MTRSVRYYIESKTDDQAVVRSVPVALPAAEGARRQVAAQGTNARAESASVSVPRRRTGRRRVAQLMRAAIRRHAPDR